MRSSVFAFFLASLLFGACTPTTTEVFQIEESSLFEGPLFEGPNSGQVRVEEQLTNWLNGLNKDRSMVRSVRLKNASFQPDLAQEEVELSDAGITFASENSEMLQAASLNPIKELNEWNELSVGSDVDLAPFFKDGYFIVLLDLGMKEDLYDNYEAKVKLEFEVELKD